MASFRELPPSAKRFIKNMYTERNERSLWHYVADRHCVLASKVQTVTKYVVFTFGRRLLLRTAGVPVNNRLCAVLPSFTAAAVEDVQTAGLSHTQNGSPISQDA